MSNALANYGISEQKRKLRKKKLAAKTGQEQPQNPANVVKKMRAVQRHPVSMTITDAQRQNRETSKRWKKKATRIAGGFAIGLHLIGLVVLTVYFVRKKVLEMNEDKVQSIVMTQAKPQPKRRTPPRPTRRPEKPKSFKIRAPKGQPVTTSAKIPMGTARFTLPASDVSTRTIMAPSSATVGRDLFSGSQQASIVTTTPKFEMPKFESTSLVSRLDMGTNLAQTDFNDAGNFELASVNLGDAKQAFNEFLKKVRDRIKQVQRFPPRVQNLDDGSSATIRFTLFNDGTIRNPQVTVSSGSNALDNAALAAVRNAVPYPAFPEGQESNSLRIEIPIIFELAN